MMLQTIFSLLPHTASSAFHDRALGFRVSLTTQLLRQLSLSDRQTSISSDDEEFEKWGYFGMLPVCPYLHLMHAKTVNSNVSVWLLGGHC